MQLLTILILVTLPIIFVQFVSARMSLLSNDDTVTSATIDAVHEQVNQQPDDSSVNKAVVAFQGEDLSFLYEEIEDDVEGAKLSLFEEDLEHSTAEQSNSESVNNKKVRLIKGKQNVQGMEFLSIVLMLKEKQK